MRLGRANWRAVIFSPNWDLLFLHLIFPDDERFSCSLNYAPLLKKNVREPKDKRTITLGYARIPPHLTHCASGASGFGIHHCESQIEFILAHISSPHATGCAALSPTLLFLFQPLSNCGKTLCPCLLCPLYHGDIKQSEPFEILIFTWQFVLCKFLSTFRYQNNWLGTSKKKKPKTFKSNHLAEQLPLQPTLRQHSEENGCRQRQPLITILHLGWFFSLKSSSSAMLLLAPLQHVT